MKHYLRFLMTLVMIVFAGGVVCADEFTYTVASKTSVTSTDAPSGVTATYQNTGTSTSGDYKWQVTSGKNATLTIKGLTGKVNAITLDIKKTKSKSDGNLTVKINNKDIYSKDFGSEVTTSYNKCEYSLENTTQTSGDIVIKVSCATTSSIFCKSFTIEYEPAATDTRTKTSLSFGEEYDGKTKKINFGESFTAPTAILTADGSEIKGTIEYSSDNDKVASVNKETGAITLGSIEGKATITATFAGDATYKNSEASYIIELNDPNKLESTFDFTQGTEDYGSGIKPTSGSTDNDYFYSSTWTNENVVMKTSGKVRWFKSSNGNDLRFYDNNGLATFEISTINNYHIASITLTGDAFNSISTYGKYTNKKWEGNAKKVTFQANSKGNGVETITVTYVPDVTLTTAASSFATYAADYAVDYSAAGLDAYAITLDESKGTVAYNAIEGTTPAGTAVLVKGNASTTYSLAPSTDKEATVTTALQISDGNVTAADNLYYGFATLNGVSGFKLVQNGVTIPAKKGYLKLSSADNAKTFYAFDGNTTGIEETFSKNEAEKALAPMYNISGQRVGEGYKGIVIVNGKKYVK